MSVSWSDVKSILSKSAPWLGTALGGPLGGLAGELLGKALGEDPEQLKDPANVMKVLSRAGTDWAAIKRAENEMALRAEEMGYKHVEEMEKLSVERARLAVEDTKSARRMAVETGDVWTPRILGFVVLVGWLTIQWFLLTHIVPLEMRELVARTLGTLDLAVGLVLGYYFGSSAGSRQKDEIRARQAQKERNEKGSTDAIG